MSSPKKTRRRLGLFHEQRGQCFWCREFMDFHDPNAPTFCTIDHLYPKGDPRRHTFSIKHEQRYVAACKHCNNLRGDTPFEDFLATISTAFSWVLPNGKLALHPHYVG